MSEPYVGRHYATTGLLLLGESAYSWEENGQLQHPSKTHAADLVDWIIGSFDNTDQRFMRLLSRAITGTYSPSKAQLQHAWDRVAFTNFVSGSVGVGARVRPSPAMWRVAERTFLDETLPQLQPRRIVVLGKHLWNNMPHTPTYVTDDVSGYALRDGTVAMCWATLHPAGGLSWSALAEIVQFACGHDLRLPVISAANGPDG